MKVRVQSGTITFECPTCFAGFEVQAEAAGTSAPCPFCKTVLVAPRAGQTMLLPLVPPPAPNTAPVQVQVPFIKPSALASPAPAPAPASVFPPAAGPQTAPKKPADIVQFPAQSAPQGTLPAALTPFNPPTAPQALPVGLAVFKPVSTPTLPVGRTVPTAAAMTQPAPAPSMPVGLAGRPQASMTQPGPAPAPVAPPVSSLPILPPELIGMQTKPAVVTTAVTAAVLPSDVPGMQQEEKLDMVQSTVDAVDVKARTPFNPAKGSFLRRAVAAMLILTGCAFASTAGVWAWQAHRDTFLSLIATDVAKIVASTPAGDGMPVQAPVVALKSLGDEKLDAAHEALRRFLSARTWEEARPYVVMTAGAPESTASAVWEKSNLWTLKDSRLVTTGHRPVSGVVRYLTSWELRPEGSNACVYQFLMEHGTDGPKVRWDALSQQLGKGFSNFIANQSARRAVCHVRLAAPKIAPPAPLGHVSVVLTSSFQKAENQTIIAFLPQSLAASANLTQGLKPGESRDAILTLVRRTSAQGTPGIYLDFAPAEALCSL